MKKTDVLRKTLVLALCVAVCNGSVFADSIMYLKNGTSTRGTTAGSSADAFVVKQGSTRTEIPVTYAQAIRTGETVVSVDDASAGNAPAAQEKARPEKRGGNAGGWLLAGLCALAGGYLAYSHGAEKIKSSDDNRKKGQESIQESQVNAFIAGVAYDYWYYTGDSSAYYDSNYYADRSYQKSQEAVGYFDKQRDDYGQGVVYKNAGYVLMAAGVACVIKAAAVNSEQKKQIANIRLDITRSYAGLMYSRKFSL